MGPKLKRKRTTTTVEEIPFDPSSRHEYLTGFRKRKQARIKQAQEIAEKKAHEAKLAQRRRIREARKEELKQHLESVNARIYNDAGVTVKINGDKSESAEEWNGISDDEDDEGDVMDIPAPLVRGIDHEDEYVDEDRYTTVTVTAIEDDSFPVINDISDEKTSKPPEKKPSEKKDVKKKEKKKKFRYLSKAERQKDRKKQGASKSKKAAGRKGK